ncbi:MAG: helix-turn-helix domain-containing protein [Parvularculaceae bacterium]
MEELARTAKQVGAILRRRRRRLGLSQAELGERAGVRQATISSLESGEQGARLKTVCDVMSVLGVEFVIRDRSKLSIEALADGA